MDRVQAVVARRGWRGQLAGLTALLTALLAGPLAAPAGAVIGGRAVPAHTFRAVAEVVTGTRLCSGVVIAPRIVLLALHCQAGKDSRVRIGNPDQGGLMQERSGVIALPAPQLQPPPAITGDTDVEALVLSRAVAPAPVPVESAADAPTFGLDETRVVIAGFGEASPNAPAPRIDRVRLREADMLVQDCFGLVATADGSPYVNCAAPAPTPARSIDGGNPCAGDSGGPVLGLDANFELVVTGVLSGGAQPQCATGTPAVFTPLASELDWTTALLTTPLPAPSASPRFCAGDRRRLAAQTRSVAALRSRARRHRHDRSLARELRSAQARRRGLANRVYISC